MLAIPDTTNWTPYARQMAAKQRGLHVVGVQLSKESASQRRKANKQNHQVPVRTRK